MVIAMMLPMSLVHVRHLARWIPGRRRHRAALGFLLGYLAVWIAAQAVIGGVLRGAGALVGETLIACIAVVAALAWEIRTRRYRPLIPAHRTTDPVRHGWRADRACAAYGVASAVACVARCFALMAVCSVFAHNLPVMAGVFGVQMSGGHQRRHSPHRSAVVLALAACAIGWGLARLS